MAQGILNLTENNFAGETAHGVLLVDFWASWCGPCRMQGQILEELAGQLPAGVRIGKINVDEETALAARFGVQSIPTLLLFKDGQQVKQMVGVQSAAVLTDLLKAAAAS